MQNTLAKRELDKIAFLMNNLSMHQTFSKREALDKVRDLIELLRGQNLHHQHAKCKDETLLTIDKLDEVFELPTQVDNYAKYLSI